MKPRKILSVLLCLTMLSTMLGGLTLTVSAETYDVRVVTSLEFEGVPMEEVKKYTEAQIYWSDTDEPFESENGYIGGSWHQVTDVNAIINNDTASVTGTIHPASLSAYYIVIVIYGHTERVDYQNLIGYFAYAPKSNDHPKADRGALYSGPTDIHVNGSISQLGDEHGRWAYCILSDEPAVITAASTDTSCGTVSSAGGSFDIGSSISFTASPRTGCRFLGWYKGDKFITDDLTLDLIATYDADYTAAFEKKLSYIVNNGEATITGCDPSITGSLTIPETLGGYPVTAIGSRAFYNNTALTNVIIPDGITQIGSYAFSGCTNLESVNFGSGITRIDSFAFNSCTKLQSAVLPSSVSIVESSAFKKCTSLTNVALSPSMTSITTSLFEGCTSLVNVTVPSGITEIGDRAFYGCTKLMSVSLPSTLNSFGNMVFYNCGALLGVELPNGMTNIGTYTFYGCRSLESVTLPIGIDTIDKYVFYNCSSLTSLVIPEGVTTIGASALYRCSGLTSISLPDSLATISSSAFYYCTSLTEITIPANVDSIAANAFKNSALTTIRCYPNTYAEVFGNTNGFTVILLDQHVHTFGDWSILKAATCSETGIRRRTCSICGHEDTEIIPTLPHTYQTTVIAPTCTADGSTQHVCSVCGNTYNENIVPALGHDYDSVVTDPTCTEDGFTSHTCSRCSNTYNDNIVPALGHDYIDTISEPTCTTAGFTLHECSRCSDKYVDEFVNAVPHEYVPEVTAPTCTEGGYTTYKCRFCGTVSETTDYTSALGHDYVAVVTAPTCTEDGYTTHTCSRCGSSYNDSATQKTGHLWGAWTDHPGDSTKEIRYCTKCDASETRDKAVDSPFEKIGGYKVRITGLDPAVRYVIRFATGEYQSLSAVKTGQNAGFIQVSGVSEAVVVLPTHGLHTIAIQGGSSAPVLGAVTITSADIESEFIASTDDLNIKVENLYAANYVKFYKDGKSVATVGSSKFSNDGLKYWLDTSVPSEGTYTVRIAYLDGTVIQNAVTFTVPKANAAVNGRIFTLSDYGADNVTYIRFAKGVITTSAEMKAAEDLRIFGAKYFREDTAAFAALDAPNGETTTYTVQIGYQSGYSEFITFEITPTVPVITVGEGTITIGNAISEDYYIDWIRCAPGDLTSLYAIRHANLSQVKKARDINDGQIVFTGLEAGVYTLYYLYDGYNLSEGRIVVNVQ